VSFFMFVHLMCTFSVPHFLLCLPIDAAVHRSCVLMRRTMRMEILLLMLVQLLKLSLSLHLCGGGGPGTWRRCCGVEAGPGRLLRGQSRRRAGSRGRRLRRSLFDVVVLAENAIVVQVKSISDTEPNTHVQTSRICLFLLPSLQETRHCII